MSPEIVAQHLSEALAERGVFTDSGREALADWVLVRRDKWDSEQNIFHLGLLCGRLQHSRDVGLIVAAGGFEINAVVIEDIAALLDTSSEDPGNQTPLC